MNICPITYESCGNKKYSDKGLRLLAPGLKQLHPLAYTAAEQRLEAMQRADKISIQGIQPKLSAVLNIKKGRFEFIDKKGKYILKPQHHLFPELPQNEDLTMRLAALVGINIPLHGLVYSKDESFTYFIKRFDRKGHIDKIPVEDFAQLSGRSRDTKYNYTMEKLIELIDDYCTFPAIEKAKLFRLFIFNYLIGNEDMHLKNYSVITNNNKVELSPAYDLLNSTIVLKGNAEEIALHLRGKKKNINKDDLINYFGKDRCRLTDVIIARDLQKFSDAIPFWDKLIKISFLSISMKLKYSALLYERAGVIGII